MTSDIFGLVPTYYLDLSDGEQVLVDPEGNDLPGLDAVRQEAVLSARELIAHAALRGERAEHRQFLVRDEVGKVVLILEFKEALEGG